MYFFHGDVLVGLDTMRTELVPLGLCVEASMAPYWQKDEQVYDMFRRVFLDWNVSIPYMSGTSYIHKLMETRFSKCPVAQAMSLKSTLEMQLYLDAFMFIEEWVQTKLVWTACN